MRNFNPSRALALAAGLVITEADTRRFWAKVALPDENGCLLWTAAKNSAGYGNFGYGSRTVKAHRFAYEAMAAPIPDGLSLDHLCRNRACVAPDHLEPVTHRTNVLRGESPSALRARLTHCPQGHPYSEENTRVSSRNERSCRTCHRSRERARKTALRQGVNS